jgi:hypothetical protein
MIGLDNNDNFNFFGMRKKSKMKASSIPGFSYKPIKSKSNSSIGTYNFIGNPVSLGPKKNKFVGHQSYWKENQKRIPIWMQRNDDNRLGGRRGKTTHAKVKNNYYDILEKERSEARYKVAPPYKKLEMIEEKVGSLIGKKRVRKEEYERLAKTQASLEIEAEKEAQKERDRLDKEDKKRNEKAKREERKKERQDKRAADKAQKEKDREEDERRKERRTRKEKIRKKEELEEKKIWGEFESKVDSAKAKIYKEKLKTEKEKEKKLEVEKGIAGVIKARNLGPFSLTTPAAAELEYTIAQKREKGKMPTAKELEKYAKLEGKKFRTKIQVQTGTEKKIVQEPVLDRFGNQVINPRTGMPEYVEKIVETPKTETKTVYHPAALYKTAVSIAEGTSKMLSETYGKKERVATQKVRRLVRGGLGAAFGSSITQTSFGPAIRGRPSGPSGKYMIEGRPVFEAEYQKWAAEQRAKNRIMPSQQQQAPITIDEATAMQMQSAQQSQEENFASTNVPLTPGEIEATKQMQIPKRGYTSEELKMAQELAQQQDNILNAPSFMKGELKATGGSLLTSTGPQIMDAPNAFKGQLRNLQRGASASVGEVKLGERPQTNPYSDTYLDIELGSNKPVLKKRITEKWATGEAL